MWTLAWIIIKFNFRTLDKPWIDIEYIVLNKEVCRIKLSKMMRTTKMRITIARINNRVWKFIVDLVITEPSSLLNTISLYCRKRNLTGHCDFLSVGPMGPCIIFNWIVKHKNPVTNRQLRRSHPFSGTDTLVPLFGRGTKELLIVLPAPLVVLIKWKSYKFSPLSDFLRNATKRGGLNKLRRSSILTSLVKLNNLFRGWFQ